MPGAKKRWSHSWRLSEVFALYVTHQNTLTTKWQLNSLAGYQQDTQMTQKGKKKHQGRKASHLQVMLDHHTATCKTELSFTKHRSRPTGDWSEGWGGKVLRDHRHLTSKMEYFLNKAKQPPIITGKERQYTIWLKTKSFIQKAKP